MRSLFALSLLALLGACSSVPTVPVGGLTAPASAATELWIVPEPPSSPKPSGSAVAPDTSPFELTRTEVRADACGPLVDVSVEQTFLNAGAESAPLEFAPPLPRSGLVHGFSLRFGERHLRGLVLPRAQAEDLFERLAGAGTRVHFAAQSEGAWLTSTALAPQQEIAVEIRFTQGLAHEDGSYGFRWDPGAWGSDGDFSLEARSRSSCRCPRASCRRRNRSPPPRAWHRGSSPALGR